MEKQKERRKGVTIRISLKSKSLREMRKPNRKKSPKY